MTDTSTPKEGFLRRWARLKSTPEQAPVASPGTLGAAVQPALQPALHPAVQPAVQPAVSTVAGPARQAPTLDDVARLTPQSDYSAFVAKGVTPAVRRLALKKLFADPNFAVMDGLDIYIDDYTKASPLSDAMLAALKHAPGVLTRLLGESDEPGQTAHADLRADAAPAAHDGASSRCLAEAATMLDGAIADSATPVDAKDAVPALRVAPVAHANVPHEAGPSPQGNHDDSA